MSEIASYEFEELQPGIAARESPVRVIERAELEAERILENARADGHQQGLQAGRDDGAQEVRAALSALAEAAEGVERLRGQLADAVERDAVELALDLAGKILAGELLARPAAVVEVVQGALRRLSGRQSITVVLNPQDIELIRASIGEIDAASGVIERCELIPDQRVGRGGAIVRTSEGEIDAGVQSQLERAREIAMTALRGAEPQE